MRRDRGWVGKDSPCTCVGNVPSGKRHLDASQAVLPTWGWPFTCRPRPSTSFLGCDSRGVKRTAESTQPQGSVHVPLTHVHSRVATAGLCPPGAPHLSVTQRASSEDHPRVRRIRGSFLPFLHGTLRVKESQFIYSLPSWWTPMLSPALAVTKKASVQSGHVMADL